MISQKQMILGYLQKHGSLTVAEALEKLNCYALSQRAGELRKDGHPIRSEMVRVASGKRIARYWLEA